MTSTASQKEADTVDFVEVDKPSLSVLDTRFKESWSVRNHYKYEDDRNWGSLHSFFWNAKHNLWHQQEHVQTLGESHWACPCCEASFLSCLFLPLPLPFFPDPPLGAGGADTRCVTPRRKVNCNNFLLFGAGTTTSVAAPDVMGLTLLLLIQRGGRERHIRVIVWVLHVATA